MNIYHDNVTMLFKTNKNNRHTAGLILYTSTNE